MTYEAFKKELYQNVLKQAKVEGGLVKLLEKGCVCADEQLLKAVCLLNLNTYGEEDAIIREDMLCITWQNSTHPVMIHWKVRSLYESYKREGWQSVLPEIAMKLQHGHETARPLPFGENGYERSSDRLIIRPLNFSMNREELDNCVYWKYGEIALVLYALIYDMDRDFMTMKINRDMLEKWGVSDVEALTNALLNTYSKMPPRLYYGTDIRMEYDLGEGIFMKEDEVSIEIHREDQDEGLRGYRLTTARWLNGAVAFFYPGVKERLAQLLGGDYYVGFTSIHEAVIHPVQHKVLGEMKAAIQHTNAVFDQREMLTNCVYRYCRARNELIEV